MRHDYLGTLSATATDHEVALQDLDHVFVTNVDTQALFVRLTDVEANVVLATWPIGAGFSGPIPAGIKLRQGSTLRATATTSPAGTGAPAAAVYASLAFLA